MKRKWPSARSLEAWLGVLGHEYCPKLSETTKTIEEALVRSSSRIVVVGRNCESEWLLQNFAIRGVLDDFFDDETWRTHQVLRSQDLNESDLVINCSTSISPIAVASHLDRVGVRHVGYASLAAHASKFPIPKFIVETQSSFAKHLRQWSALVSMLADDASRREFSAVSAFRLTGDLEYVRDFKLKLEDQYMEDFLLSSIHQPFFLDVGGYHGETTKAFCERVPDYRAVRIYEPSSLAAEIASRETSEMRDVEVINCGVGEVSSWQTFADDGTTAASFRRSGEEQVWMTSLDDEHLDGIDLIKMDIEGGEIQALRGARQLIGKSQPSLAIASYHNGSDPINLVNEVRSMEPTYDIRFRHYTQGWSESVLFFMPR